MESTSDASTAREPEIRNVYLANMEKLQALRVTKMKDIKNHKDIKSTGND